MHTVGEKNTIGSRIDRPNKIECKSVYPGNEPRVLSLSYCGRVMVLMCGTVSIRSSRLLAVIVDQTVIASQSAGRSESEWNGIESGGSRYRRIRNNQEVVVNE